MKTAPMMAMMRMEEMPPKRWLIYDFLSILQNLASGKRFIDLMMDDIARTMK
jgi:hypothetical protein